MGSRQGCSAGRLGRDAIVCYEVGSNDEWGYDRARARAGFTLFAKAGAKVGEKRKETTING